MPGSAAPSDAVIRETGLLQVVRVIEVASIEYHRLQQLLFQTREIGTAKLVPFGHDDQPVCTGEGVVTTLADGDAVLIKGSNASGMGKLADRLREWSAAGQQSMERAVESGAGVTNAV